jgi:hypothetical protein
LDRLENTPIKSRFEKVHLSFENHLLFIGSMKIIFFAWCIILISYSSNAQDPIVWKNQLKNVDGTEIAKSTLNEEGSKSLPEKNCLFALKTRDGKVYSKVRGRIDLQLESFIFSLDEQEFRCALPLVEIIVDSCDSTLSGSVFRTGFPAIDKQHEKSLYQVLSKGKATLLKHYAISWQDLTPYNSAKTTRVYSQLQEYYLFLNGKMISIDKNKKDLANLSGTTKTYISRNKLNLKKEKDLLKLVTYYNSL